MDKETSTGSNLGIDVPKGSPLTLEEGVDGITDMMDDLVIEDEDNQTNVQSEEAPGELEDDQEYADDFEDDEGADDLAENTTDDDDEDEDGDGVGFVARTAQTKLNDGTPVSIQELVDGYYRQGDYTRKTQAHSEDVRTFDGERQQVYKLGQDLQTQRNFFLQNVQQAFMPPQPDPRLREDDPFAYYEAKDNYERASQLLNQAWEQHRVTEGQLSNQNRFDSKKTLDARNQKILQTHTDFQDPVKVQAFDKDFNDVFLPTYGYTTEEVSQVVDDRMLMVIKDAMAFQKIKLGRKKAKGKIAGKPRMMRAGKRINPGTKTSRGAKARASRLAQTGSVEDAVASIMDMDI